MAAVFAPKQNFSTEPRQPTAAAPLKPPAIELQAVCHAFDLPLATDIPSVEVLDATTAEIRRKHGEVRLVSKSHISSVLRKK